MGKGIRLPLWLIIVIVLCYLGYQVFSGGFSGDQTSSPASEENTAQEIQPTSIPATARPKPTRAPSTQNSDQNWLVMVYQDADDKVLEKDIWLDLNEIEKVGSTDQVQIISQIDRYAGGYTGQDDFTGARRYRLEQDDDLLALHSPVLDDLGEVNMADGGTLVDFVTWAVDAYPSDRYVLILSDHGMGWPGGWSDASARRSDQSNVPIASALGDNIFLMELDQALADIQQQTGINKFELIGLDACLMSDLAVYTMLEPYARFAVASQETEPGIGWAYTSFLQNLAENPGIDGAELGNLIVDSYVQEDERLLDDRARADYAGGSSPLSSLFGGAQVMSAAQLQAQLEQDITLTAVDLSQIPVLNNAVNELAYSLQGEKQKVIARARGYSQSYTSVWGSDVPPSYIDLGNFTKMMVNENISQETIQRADAVQQAIQAAVIAEKHGSRKPGSNGISIYFPNSTLYNNDTSGPESYTRVAERFAKTSLWDDFLAFHYTNRSFDLSDAQAVLPSAGQTVRGPGQGQINISAINLSADTASPDSPVKMSATVSGDNIGYIFLFVGYLDSQSNSILALDTDYLESATTREVDGVYYPEWPQDKVFKLSLNWEPTVFEISDGSVSEAVLLNPASYGVDAANAVYTVDGQYTFADSGDQRHARLYFSAGKLRQVFGFTDSIGTGAPAEIIPQTGDSFTIQQKWINLDSNGNSTGSDILDGQTLTFGAEMFTWQEVYAPVGEYMIGFIASDLDGISTDSFTQISVK